MERKTSTERVRAYRARMRANKPPKKPPKSSLERNREFRARRKALKEQAAKLNLLAAQNASFRGNMASDLEYLNPTDSRVTSASENKSHIRDEQDEYQTSEKLTNKNRPTSAYTKFLFFQPAHSEFNKQFFNNLLGTVCSICDRIWFKNDVKLVDSKHEKLLRTAFPAIMIGDVIACQTCRNALARNTIPTLSKSNGFIYPELPDYLPKLDVVSERLISPRIPFMQIRRLRHVVGQHGIHGQIINLPISKNTMVKYLPRDHDDDYCINIHVKGRKIYSSSCLSNLVKRRNMKIWLKYLIQTPLYRFYNIRINNGFFDDQNVNYISSDEISEDVPMEESLIAKQQTLLWKDEKYLRFESAEGNIRCSPLFAEHAEELSFPEIYLGQFRKFPDGLNVTPFMLVTSELRRADRRGVIPHHLLYMAMKIMTLRVRDSLTIASKPLGKETNITREQSEEYINTCIDSNLAFLRSIPNSTWYWTERRRDLFAMIRQLGRPTIFLTLTANEIGWIPLLQTLYKFKNNGAELSEQEAANLEFIEKSALINEDPVICAIYFNKLINVLMNVLQSKKISPFGKYRVAHYFTRIEFQHSGSPQAHIFLWLENAPKNPIGEDYTAAIKMINALTSVAEKEASGNIRLQKHQHTSTCYEKKCRFEGPFMPCRSTTIVTPTSKEDPSFVRNAEHYRNIRMNLEKENFESIDEFFAKNNIISDVHYLKILQAGITRPQVFLKRLPAEKWNNSFNPFIFNILKCNMDIQFITDDNSCAAYIVDHVNETNRGFSDLRQQIMKITEEHPDFDIVKIARKMSVDMLNTVEISTQEAAWYLLREPTSKISDTVAYIPTVRPVERQKIRKTAKELEKLNDDDGINIWRENWFDKYAKRPEDLEALTLAQFVANYTCVPTGKVLKRTEARIIRYRNYDMRHDFNEYRREMVTLHIPFRNEETEILEDMKFIEIYERNKNLIYERRKEFETDSDIQRIMDIVRGLCFKEENQSEDSNLMDVGGRDYERDDLRELYDNSNSLMLNKSGTIAVKKESPMDNEMFDSLMQQANDYQKKFLMHVMSDLSFENGADEIFPQAPNINGSLIATEDSDLTSYHGPKAVSLSDSQTDNDNELQTLEDVLVDFMKRRGESFDCPTFRAHFLDMGHPAMKRSTFLLLSETWLHDHEKPDVPNFNFVVYFKCPNVEAGGIVTHKNANDRSRIVTPNMDVNVHKADALSSHSSGIGDICAVECRLENGQIIVMVAISISNYATVDDIIDLIHEILLAYTIEGAALLKRNLDKLPMILSGNFNMDFNADGAQPLMRFLDEKFGLKLNTYEDQSMTDTIVDAVFSRHLEHLESELFVSYFGYHKPIIPPVKSELMEIDE